MGKISKFFVSWLMPKNVHTGKIKLSQRNLEGGHQWPFLMPGCDFRKTQEFGLIESRIRC